MNISEEEAKKIAITTSLLIETVKSNTELYEHILSSMNKEKKNKNPKFDEELEQLIQLALIANKLMLKSCGE